MRQAHFRNMRSKCRCSCVLQFTLYRGVSSVLHRPPSQMIHCIVLCFQFSDLRPEIDSAKEARTKYVGCTSQQGGEDHKPGLRRELFEPLDIPQLPVTSTGNGVRYLNKRGPSLHRTADRKIRPSSRDVASSGRRATAPRTDNSCVRTHQLSLYPEGCNGCASPDGQATDNDPSAGSPTETLLRLLLPLNATVWSSSRNPG